MRFSLFHFFLQILYLFINLFHFDVIFTSHGSYTYFKHLYILFEIRNSGRVTGFPKYLLFNWFVSHIFFFLFLILHFHQYFSFLSLFFFPYLDHIDIQKLLINGLLKSFYHLMSHYFLLKILSYKFFLKIIKMASCQFFIMRFQQCYLMRKFRCFLFFQQLSFKL